MEEAEARLTAIVQDAKNSRFCSLKNRDHFSRRINRCSYEDNNEPHSCSARELTCATCGGAITPFGVLSLHSDLASGEMFYPRFLINHLEIYSRMMLALKPLRASAKKYLSRKPLGMTLVYEFLLISNHLP